MDAKKFITSVYAAAEAEELDRLCEMVSEDYELIDVTQQEPFTGRNGLRANMEEWYRGLSNIRIIHSAMIAEGHRIAVELEVTAAHTGQFLGYAGTGRRIGWRGCAVYELDRVNTRIVKERFYYDGASVVRQLGRTPTVEA